MNNLNRKPADFSAEIEEDSVPIWQHLEELRWALLRCLGVVCVALIVIFNYCDKLVHFFELPLLKVLPAGQQQLYYTGLTDKFFVYLKVSLLAALALTFPYLMYELWKFVAPALKSCERKFLLPFIVLATATLFLGFAFCYYVVIPSSYKFLLDFGSENDRALITLTEYFDLTLKLLFAMGILFELPVLMMVLAKLGVVTADTFSKYRKVALVANAVVSAIATPSPDPLSMILVMIPIQLLYEIGILAVRYVGKKAVEI